MSDLSKRTQVASARKALYVLAIIWRMKHRGDVISFSSVARTAGVTRMTLYRHLEIRRVIEACRVSSMTKRELQQEVIRLRLQILHGMPPADEE